MASRDEPLLSNRPSTDDQSEESLAREDALLIDERRRVAGHKDLAQQQQHQQHPPWQRYKDIGLFVWALLATAAVVVLAVVYQKQHSAGHGHGLDTTPGKRNLVFMVSDGMGPTSLALTRSFMQAQRGLPHDAMLTLDAHHIGQSRTRSTSSLITDSAAGATAFSCGKKSYNGAIATLDDHSPCGTVLEAAKRAGYMTGLVVTTRITDATPACFAAHVNLRSEEDRIAEQLIGDQHPLGRVVDLIIGGGRCHFLPNSTDGSCRADDKDVIGAAQQKGWNYISTRREFDSLKSGAAADLPLLALLADTDVPYELDRAHVEDQYPSLDEMARTALAALSAATKNSDRGFFLMVEGSRIDHAGHANDPAAQVHEVLAYDQAFASVLRFLHADAGDTPGVLVATSDHETGGLSVARQLHDEYPEYVWFPALLANASHSAEWMTSQYFAHLGHAPDAQHDDLSKYVKHLVRTGLGVHDITQDEVDLLTTRPEIAAYTFADIISRRAQTGWATHGHSGKHSSSASHSASCTNTARRGREHLLVVAVHRKAAHRQPREHRGRQVPERLPRRRRRRRHRRAQGQRRRPRRHGRGWQHRLLDGQTPRPGRAPRRTGPHPALPGRFQEASEASRGL